MMGYEEARKLAASMLGERRLHHSDCVAETALRLAPGFGADPEKARLAGILHDIMKEQEDSVMLRYLLVPGGTGVDDPGQLHALWHSWAGAAYAERELGLDADICDAIRYHTSGRADMTPLEKTVFLADYISDDRTFDGSAEVREKAKENQDEALLLALQNEITHLIKKKRAVDLHSVAAYDWLLKTLSEREENNRRT